MPRASPQHIASNSMITHCGHVSQVSLSRVNPTSHPHGDPSRRTVWIIREPSHDRIFGRLFAYCIQ
jgi:hypothetical protein